ncbi:hypothetical protein QBC33DRAFT_537703 [Phialemonium atrogriseum]|uniref:Uncharacterized protein n=1 Tax=Phialemonium atrogriseum TaxID=1093897 RepID=A0AAJ0FM19_9PEZI|nr:uncharacterized protein QBC33DRAFT_537703 [Phialemonium atrogriseum]KAK1767908.1 hypothetical protein QBC33DRAFT_537703 [Phialemonium atrogriseum]
MDRGQFETMLSDDEIALPARSFHAMDDTTFSAGASMAALGAPGTAQAMALLSSRLGLDLAVFQAAALHQMRQMRHMAPAFPGLGPGPSFATVPSLPMPGLGGFTATAAPQGQFGQGQQQQPLDTVLGAMASLQQQRDLGNVTDEEVAARNRDYLAALRTASSPQSRLPYPAAPTLIAPTAFPSSSALPSPPVVWWPPAAAPPPPPSRTDLFGSGPWPPAATPRDPIALFRDDDTHHHLSGFDVLPAWSALPEDQKEAYRARSETLRREAWAEHETAVAEGTSPFALPGREQRQPRPGNLAGLESGGERFPGVPGMPTIITGLKVFRDELGAGMEFQEVLRGWDALTEGQREAYEARANAANAAARAAYRQGRNL